MYDNNVEVIKKAQKGNKEAMSYLIENNSGLIWSIVKRFLGRGYEQDDIYQICTMGFIKSIKRFDTNFEVKLSTYAVPYMIGEIKRYIRDDGMIKVSRSIKELAIKIKEIQKEYMHKTNKEIGINEIAKKLKITKEEVAMAIEASNPVESIYEKVGENKDGEGLSLIDKIVANKDETNTIIDNIILKEAILNLNNKDKQIIMLRYFKDKTQSQVAKMLGITQVQVSRTEKKILASMRESMGSLGDGSFGAGSFGAGSF